MRQAARACVAAILLLTALADGVRGQMVFRSPQKPTHPTPVPDRSNQSQGNSQASGYVYYFQWEVRWMGGGGGSLGYTPAFPYSYAPRTRVPSPVRNYDYNNNYYPLPDGQSQFHPSNEDRKQRILASRQREATPQTIARIEKLIALGDELFARGEYSQAADRYRTAADKGSADACLRQAFAEIALGNYEAATAAFRNAAALKPDWTDDAFDLKQIYKPGALEKTTERLTRELSETPGKPGLLASMCLQLHFSGDREQARAFAMQAADIGGADASLVEKFLSGPKKF
jgi:tetratricopeptide (TPR) repeat protein